MYGQGWLWVFYWEENWKRKDDTMGVGLAIASAALTVGGTVAQASAANRQAKTERSIADYNYRQAQITARNQADEAYEEGQRAADDKRRAVASVVAQNAASGTSMAGTPLEILGEVSRRAEVKRLDTIRRGLTEAQQTRFQGELARYEGYGRASTYKSSIPGTLLNGGARLVSSGTNLYKSLGAGSNNR